MRLLLHICCSTCALYPLSSMRSRGIGVTGLWFNPNIHPFTEFRARRDSVRSLQNLVGLDLVENDEYGLVNFVRAVAGAEEDRCRHCYEVRLEETARTASAEGLDAFSTSLLISPYQDQDRIRTIGENFAGRYDVEFHFEDFRPGFRQAQQQSRDLGLYRQKYCGCIYSEMERYRGGLGEKPVRDGSGRTGRDS